jgi:hypothetical protein
MYALSPSLFELFTGNLTPYNLSLFEYYQNIQFAFLNKLFVNCSRHDHFVANSSLLRKADVEQASIFSNNTTKDYFKIIVELLLKFASHPSIEDDISNLILIWISEIIELISFDNGFILKSEPFPNLFSCIIKMAYSTNETISLLCNKILLRTLEKFCSLNQDNLARYFFNHLFFLKINL